MIRIAALLVGYAFGLIQTGYIYGKSKGVDIRTRGSGNAGATNALRVFGKKGGAITLLGDFLKALIPCLIARFVNVGLDNDLLVLWTGLGVILGHDFPFYLHFKGGKGVASTFAVFLVADFRMGLIAGIVWLILFGITRMVSVGSICSLSIGGILIAIDMVPVEAKVIALVIPAISIFLHRSNISRILKGNENKISFSSKK